jgi:hypothetical protein
MRIHNPGLDTCFTYDIQALKIHYRSRIQIRIRVTSWIRINVNGRIRIRLDVKRMIRICINVTRIRYCDRSKTQKLLYTTDTLSLQRRYRIYNKTKEESLTKALVR